MEGSFKYPSPGDSNWPKNKKEAKEMIEEHNKGYIHDNYHANARRFFRPTNLCQNCDRIAEFRSIINGELDYQLCKECFNKRSGQKRPIKSKKSIGQHSPKKQ